MKKLLMVLGALTLVVCCCVIACNSDSGQPAKKDGLNDILISKEDQINRGKYLVSIMGCNDCHTPNIMTPHGPEKDTTRLLSGHPSNIPMPPYDKAYAQKWALFSLTGTAMAGPWGESYAANLTSDETGIGSWSEQQFFKAFREGKYKGLDNTRTLLPPMPWQMFAHTSDDDVRAIFAYLKSTIPVENVVPAPVPPSLAKR